MKNTETITLKGYEMIEEKDEAIHRAAIDAFSDYMNTANRVGLPAPVEAASTLLSITAARFRKHNEGLPEEEQWPVPTELTPHQIALLVLAHHEVRLLPWIEEDPEIPFAEWLFAYQTEGPKKGLYTLGVSEFIKEFEPDIGFLKEMRVKSWLKDDAERGVLCVRDDLAAMNNGILNCRTKALMPFSPEYIFLTKSGLNYVPVVQ